MKIQSVKKTFYCYLFFVSKFLHAQKRSLKKVIFKKYFFSKTNLYFKPHISESIVVSWLIQILNFSTDHSYHFRLLNYLKKWILRVVMQFFPKKKKNYRNSPIVGIAPLHPIYEWMDEWLYGCMDNGIYVQNNGWMEILFSQTCYTQI